MSLGGGVITDDNGIAVGGENVVVASDSKPSKRGRLYRAFRELTAIAFWIYVVTKVFFFDVDYWLLSRFSPHLRWLVDYRFLWFVLALALVVLLASPLRAMGLVLYVMFYPFVLVFWRLPWLLMRLKRWTLTLALVAGVVSLARSLKFTAMMVATLVFGTVLVVEAQPHVLIA